MQDGEMHILQGLGISEGFAVGRAVCVGSRDLEVVRFPLREAELEAEVLRLQEAIATTHKEMVKAQTKIGARFGTELGGIFEAQGLLLSDKAFSDRIVARIHDERVNAEWAVHKTCEELHQQFAQIETEHLRERGEDLLDVRRYLLRRLQGMSHHELSEIEGDVVIVAFDLTPSEAMQFGRDGVVAFATETGGPTSHTSIVARALKIPAVSGLENITELLADDDPIIVDGGRGQVILHPDAELLQTYEGHKDELRQREEGFLATRELASVTRDGVKIELLANIELPEEIDDALRFGATGIGLYRSEFLYLEKSPALPTEEEHLQVARRLLEAMDPHPVVIRTFDLGGRKLAQEVMEIEEENPVLGLRGIRLTFARQDIFKTQVRALLRAGVYGNLWIMIPLVTTVEEVRRFREFCHQIMEELEQERLPFLSTPKLGAMIEVPAAAVIADRLAREVDFLSIGTNDLIQYSLAVDRNNEHVSHLYQPLHPAILRMLRFIVESAGEAGVDLAMCGEMAADPELTPLLLGLGLRKLSMSPRSVAEVKGRIRQLSVQELQRITEHCTDLSTILEVREYLARGGALSR